MKTQLLISLTFAAMTAGAEEGERRNVNWGGTPDHPWLSLTLIDREGGAQIVRVQASLNRPECAAAFHLLLDDTTLTAEMELNFARLGRAVPEVVTKDDLLCRCMNVPRAVVQEAIAGGLTTRTEVEAATGCGGVCGGCHVHMRLRWKSYLFRSSSIVLKREGCLPLC